MQIRVSHALAVAAALVVLLVSSLPQASAQENLPVEGENSLQANLENVQLEDFIRFISKFTGRNVIYRKDQIPKITFNIHSQNSFTEPELMAIFHQVMANSGLTAVAKDNALYISPSRRRRRSAACSRRSRENRTSTATSW